MDINILRSILFNKKINLIQTDELDLELKNYKIEDRKFGIRITNDCLYIDISNIKNIIIDDNKLIVYYEKNKKIILGVV